MSKRADHESYERARRAFDDMGIDDKAVFLVEAAASTLARGVQEAGHVLADELERAFGGRAEHPDAASPDAATPPGAAEPPTDARRAARTERPDTDRSNADDADPS